MAAVRHGGRLHCLCHDDSSQLATPTHVPVTSAKLFTLGGAEFQNLGSITRACPRRICGENEAAGLRLRAAVGGAVVVR